MQAVVGAGAAGLVAARELAREGHSVTVFEQGARIGGVWVLDDSVEDDPLGQAAGRSQVHSSMYDNLRVNLPRELMGFSDFPFVPEYMDGKSEDLRRYPAHQEVLRYLEAFADRFDVRRHVRLCTRVTAAEARAGQPGNRDTPFVWHVTTEPSFEQSQSYDHGSVAQPSSRTETFDALMVCNGHYAVPRLPPVQGVDAFPGRCEHSHNYRRPDGYAGQRVVIIGAHASGEDIARDVASCAGEVIMSAKTWMKPEYASQTGPFGVRHNMFRRPWPQRLCADGSVVFEDGSSVSNADVVMFCTGYHYTAPFLSDSVVDTSRSHVRPLYQHMFHPKYRECLSFIGLTFKVVPFPQFELQTKLVARVLSGRTRLPDARAVEDWMESHYGFFEEANVPDRHIHQQGDRQWPYNEWLAELCGPDVPPPAEWRVDLWSEAKKMKQKYTPDEYRDRWDDKTSVLSAHAAFKALSAPVEP